MGAGPGVEVELGRERVGLVWRWRRRRERVDWRDRLGGGSRLGAGGARPGADRGAVTEDEWDLFRVEGGSGILVAADSVEGNGGWLVVVRLVDVWVEGAGLGRRAK